MLKRIDTGDWKATDKDDGKQKESRNYSSPCSCYEKCQIESGRYIGRKKWKMLKDEE